METRFYGHACIFLKRGNFSVTTDPWFSKEGVFLASWFQFPDNTELDLTPIRNSDYIILSHEHQDHFDLNFLRTISSRTKIIIPKYTDSYLYETLKSNLENEIIVVNSLQKIELCQEINFCPVVQSVPIWDDCSLILETPEATILDVNDMKITSMDVEWIKDNFRINYLFMQFAPSAWHPYVYDYPHAKKVSILRHKTATRFDYTKEIFLSSGAERFVPCAGPPCFLDEGQFEYNFLDECVYSVLPQFYDFAKKEGFADKICLLLPGDKLEPDTDYTEINETNIRSESFVNTRKYLVDYKKRRQQIIKRELFKIKNPSGSLFNKCKSYFEPLISSSPYFREKINGRVLLDVVGAINEEILIDFSKPTDQVKLFEGEDFFCKFQVDSAFLDLILGNKLTWEQLFLSRRFHASRNPDVYNEFLIVFLRFADSHSYKAYELYDKNKDARETFEMEYEGEKYKVQRYCPHAMGDLSKAKIVNGCIVCPGHGWTFSIRDGTCLQNKCSIKIEQLLEM
ncbi:MAG: Rieske 2Fe-2S domain-containing protein [Nitrososphaerales archaeon]